MRPQSSCALRTSRKCATGGETVLVGLVVGLAERESTVQMLEVFGGFAFTRNSAENDSNDWTVQCSPLTCSPHPSLALCIVLETCYLLQCFPGNKAMCLT